MEAGTTARKRPVAASLSRKLTASASAHPPWRLASARAKSFNDKCVEKRTRRRPGPVLINKLGELYLAAAHPWIINARHNDQRLLEQNFLIRVPFGIVLGQAHEPKLHAACAQSLKHRERVACNDVKDDARILLRQPIDSRRDNSLRQGRVRTNSQFSGAGVGENANVLDALLEFVEGGYATFE